MSTTKLGIAPFTKAKAPSTTVEEPKSTSIYRKMSDVKLQYS